MLILHVDQCVWLIYSSKKCKGQLILIECKVHMQKSEIWSGQTFSQTVDDIFVYMCVLDWLKWMNWLFFFQGGSDIWWALQANEFKPSLSLLCFCASLPSSLLPSLLSNHCVVVVTLSPPSRLLSVLYISADGWLVFQTARRNECKHAAQTATMTPALNPEEETWASIGELLHP